MLVTSTFTRVGAGAWFDGRGLSNDTAKRSNRSKADPKQSYSGQTVPADYGSDNTRRALIRQGTWQQPSWAENYAWNSPGPEKAYSIEAPASVTVHPLWTRSLPGHAGQGDEERFHQLVYCDFTRIISTSELVLRQTWSTGPNAIISSMKTMILINVGIQLPCHREQHPEGFVPVPSRAADARNAVGGKEMECRSWEWCGLCPLTKPQQSIERRCFHFRQRQSSWRKWLDLKEEVTDDDRIKEEILLEKWKNDDENNFSFSSFWE